MMWSMRLGAEFIALSLNVNLDFKCLQPAQVISLQMMLEKAKVVSGLITSWLKARIQVQVKFYMEMDQVDNKPNRPQNSCC